MNAEPAPVLTDAAPNRRFSVTPFVELLVLGVAVAIAIGSYVIISSTDC